MVLLAQLERQNSVKVLTHLTDQTFRIAWIVSGEAESLEKDLAIDWSHLITRITWSIANTLICLTLAIILIWRWRSKRSISEVE